jgi:PAS domain-containing protein
MATLIMPAGSADAETVRSALRSAGHWEGEFAVVRNDGSTFPAYLRVREMLDDQRTFAGRTAVSVDLSTRVESERALLAAGNYLRAVADSVAGGLFTLDTRGCLTYMNAAAERLLGWTQEELHGRVLHDVVHTRRLDGSQLPIEESPILGAMRDGTSRRVDDDVFIRPRRRRAAGRLQRRAVRDHRRRARLRRRVRGHLGTQGARGEPAARRREAGLDRPHP